MEKEYNRSDRMVISYGSSARVICSDELDPTVRRRKEAETGDTDSRYIAMFCERYRDRGVAGRVRREATEQKKHMLPQRRHTTQILQND